jgi:hypothetical protein
MLKSKVQVAKVGDVIRSLDFNGNFTCYMIGLVVETDGDVIHCRGISRVWEGKSQRIDQKFTTVQEGGHFMDASLPGRITVLA